MDLSTYWASTKANHDEVPIKVNEQAYDALGMIRLADLKYCAEQADYRSSIQAIEQDNLDKHFDHHKMVIHLAFLIQENMTEVVQMPHYSDYWSEMLENASYLRQIVECFVQQDYEVVAETLLEDFACHQQRFEGSLVRSLHCFEALALAKVLRPSVVILAKSAFAADEAERLVMDVLGSLRLILVMVHLLRRSLLSDLQTGKVDGKAVVQTEVHS